MFANCTHKVLLEIKNIQIVILLFYTSVLYINKNYKLTISI